MAENNRDYEMLSYFKRGSARLFAAIVVNDNFYLMRYPDVAAAGVPPKKHYLENWNRSPLRAPNATLERWLFALSPLIVLWQGRRGQIRHDWLSVLKARITDVSCANMPVQKRIAMIAANRITTNEAIKGNSEILNTIGRAVEVVRTWSDVRPWLRTVEVEKPTTYTFKDVVPVGSDTIAKTRTVMLPALRHTTINNAVIYGTAQILASNSFVVDEQAADPVFSFTAGQVHECIAADGTGKAVILKDCFAQVELPEGILINGRCATNYYHFIIEYVSKGYILDRMSIPMDVPLITTDDLYPSQYEALNIVFPDRKLYMRSRSEALKVRKLHLPSIMTYMPDAPEVPGWTKAGFRTSSLDWLRSQVFRGLSLEPKLVAGKRVYLRRTAGRSILNTHEVEGVLDSFGFVAVDPAKLSFAEQVDLFSSAECIAGMLGAAFSNVIFCADGAKIIGFGPRHAISPIFQNLAHSSGCHYYLFTGSSNVLSAVKSRIPFLNDTHASFAVDVRKLTNFLETVCKP